MFFSTFCPPSWNSASIFLWIVAWTACDRQIPPGSGDLLQPRRDIDAVPEDVVVVDDHIAEMNPHAKHQPFVGGHFDVALGHQALHAERGAHRMKRAGKFEQQPVAGGLDQPPAFFGKERIDRLAMRLERRQRAELVRAHQPAVADDIGANNDAQTALDGRHKRGLLTIAGPGCANRAARSNARAC